jgi:hypothetical protein
MSVDVGYHGISTIMEATDTLEWPLNALPASVVNWVINRCGRLHVANKSLPLDWATVLVR